MIKALINSQGFIVWDYNPKFLILGTTIVCFLFGFQVGYKKWRLPNRSSVTSPLKNNEMHMNALNFMGLVLFRLGWPKDKHAVLLAVSHRRGVFLFVFCSGWTEKHATKGLGLFNRDPGFCSWELRGIGSFLKQRESVDFHFMLCLWGISMMF